MISRSTFFAALLAISSIAPIFADVAPTKEETAQQQIAKYGNGKYVGYAVGSAAVGAVIGLLILSGIKFGGQETKDLALYTMIQATTTTCVIGSFFTLIEWYQDDRKISAIEDIEKAKLANEKLRLEIQLKEQAPYKK